MTATLEHPIIVHRRREHDGAAINDRRLRRLVQSGVQVRIAAGSYADAAQWRALTPLQRHQARVLEIADRTRGVSLTLRRFETCWRASFAAVSGVCTA